jgi:uncharacterized protein YidB (DUF937 family)
MGMFDGILGGIVGADQPHQALGAGAIAQLAAKLGVNSQDLLAKLSQALPTAIDRLTSGGVVPKS